MILTHEIVLKEIKEGNIAITPFSKDQLGPASYDLTLGTTFRRLNPDAPFIPVQEDTDFKEYTEQFTVDGPFLLHPGELVLGISKEEIKLPSNICGWLQGRTRYARLGLTIHLTASFVHPGVTNKQVFEIQNVGTLPLEIYPDEKIAQIIFERCEGNATYNGWANHQEL